MENNQLIFYSTPQGSVKVEVVFENETFWLSQKRMAELFGVDVRTVNEHLKNIFKNGELQEDSVIRNFRITAADGKNYNTKFYMLDAKIKAEGEFEKYRVIQDKEYESDFDKAIKKLSQPTNSKNTKP